MRRLRPGDRLHIAVAHVLPIDATFTSVTITFSAPLALLG
jgi:hypothetical protein